MAHGFFYHVSSNSGPDVSFEIIPTVEGYAEGKDSFTVNVDAPDKAFDFIDLGLPVL